MTQRDAEDTLIARAERLGCSVVMVDDRPIPPKTRISALMVQATAFANAINRELGRTIATVERIHETAGPVWVRVWRRVYSVPELRDMLKREGHISYLVSRLLLEWRP